MNSSSDHSEPEFRLIEGAVELVGEPQIWEIKLRDGSVIDVLAHGQSIDDDSAVFELLFKGEPNFRVPTLRLPLALLPDDYQL